MSDDLKINVAEMISKAEKAVALLNGRLDFPPGEWDGEPDYLKWRDPATGLLCMVRRNTTMGTLNGYVRVPRGHPYHGRQYSPYRIVRRKPFVKKADGSIKFKKSPPMRACKVGRAEVHGGITFSGRMRRRGGGIERGWWFGFDTGHAWDISPHFLALGINFGDGVYRNFDYVKAETLSLARQIAEAKK